MAFDEQYQPVIAAVVEQQVAAAVWPSVTILFPPTGPTIFKEWQGTPPTDDEINAACAAFVAAGGLSQKATVDERTQAVATITNGKDLGKVMRGVLMLILDEFNAHAAKTNAILSAIDNNNTLANIKSAVLGITDLPTRTKQQLVTAITTIINDGDADA